MRDGAEADLEFRMLGPLEVASGGAAIPLGAGRARALLALLLVHANEVVASDRLLEELWQGTPPPSAAHALQVYVSDLRRLLEPDRDPGSPPEVLLTRRPGYVLVVADAQRDAGRFERLVAAGRSALDEHRPADAAALLSEALALWRGPVLADLADEPFVPAEAIRLESLRLVATEARIEAELALGRHTEIVTELESLVGRHPFRERLWGQLMLALYRSGRQADALRAYQRLRTTLGEEVGLEPSPELRQMEAAVLRQDPQLTIAASGPEPPGPVDPAVPVIAAKAKPTPPVGDASPIEERRVVIALFADLVGSTPLGEQLDPEELSLVVNGVVDRMTSCATALGGAIASRMGDGILALFGATQAHEDDAERAVRAGLAIVAEVDAYGHEVARSWDVDPLAARVGVDAGPVVVGGPADQQVVGDALNTAARLQAAARPGSVLVSATVRRVVGPLFDWSEPWLLDLKGKGTAVEAAEVIGPRAEPGKVRGIEGRPVPLVGREAEMALAGRLIDSVLAGAGGVLVVTGEAGAGKSRLAAEVRRRFDDSASAGGRPLWLEGRCLSWGASSAYWPFRELIREWLGASPTHPALRTRVTLRRKVDELFGSGGADISPLLAGILGLPADQEAGEQVGALPSETLRRHTFEAMRALLERLAEDGPVVVAIDDLHWADDTSLQLVEHLLPTVETAAVLLVLALRPERDHGAWRVRELALRDFAHRSGEVALESLPPGADARMLDELLGAGTLPPPMAQRLLEAAEGNPLFIEELVRSLVDVGALLKEDDRWRFVGDHRIELPGSIEAVLASRIDRIPAARRAVLGAAAVLGRQFDLGVLASVVEDDTDLEAAINELQHLHLLQQARRWPRVEYRFRHPLLQEAAYRRLVADRRRVLHRRAAHALEALFPDRLAESYGMLAYHYERAGGAERAIVYHRLAGDGARRAHAMDEASRHYGAALELAPSVPAEQARPELPLLHVGRGHTWWQLADPRAGDELRRGLEAARAADDPASEITALETLAAVEGFVEGAPPEQARARLEDALAVARRIGDRSAEISIQNRLTVALVNWLELDQALDNGQEALATARRTGDELLTARAMDGLKLVAFALGDYPGLRRLADELDDVLRRHDERWYLQFVLAETSFAVAAAGDWEGAFKRLEEAEAIGIELDLPYLLTLRAWLERTRGRYGEALRLARASVVAARQGRNMQWTAWAETNLGAVLLELDAVEDAVEHLEAGRAAAERGAMRIQLVRDAAYLALARQRGGDLSGAATELRRADDILDRISLPEGEAFLYGLDAALAVAQVRLDRGEIDAARQRIPRLLTAAESAGWAEGVARCALLLGECSWRERLVRPAVELVERALETSKSAGLPGVEWQAHAALARMGRESGDGAGAEHHARLARALVDTLAGGIDDPAIAVGFRAAAASG